MNSLAESILRIIIRRNVPVAYLELPGLGKERRDAVTYLVRNDYAKRVRTNDLSTVEWTGKIT